MKQKNIIGAVLLVLSAAVWGQTAEEIVRKMQTNLVPTTSRMQATMTVKDLLGTKQVSFVVYARGDSEALVEFTSNEVAETPEIGENLYIDLDRQGNLVSMTIEHARTNARLQEFSYQEVVGQAQSRQTSA